MILTGRPVAAGEALEMGLANRVVPEGTAREAAEEPDWRDLVDDEPQVQGVQELGDDAVNLRVVVWVDAGARRRFERHLRRRLKEALDHAGVEMPNRQVDVWIREQPLAIPEHAA